MTISATGKRAEPARRRYRRRRGFTLVEVLLVLSLLVVIAAFAAPRLVTSLDDARLDQAAEELRTSWSQARLDAAASGKTLRFQCRLGSGWGYVTAADAVSLEAGGGMTGPTAEGDLNTDASEQELTQVVFRQLLVAQQPGDPPLGAGVIDGEMSAAVLFRPDGTTSDAEAVLEAEDGRRVRVMLRGLTGSTSVEDVLGEE